jgi:hypothetical protein
MVHHTALRIPEYSSFNNDAMNLQKSWQKFCDAFVYISHDMNMYSWITGGGGGVVMQVFIALPVNVSASQNQIYFLFRW